MALFISTYIAYFIIGLLGLISHFLKQKVKGQTIHSITDWFIKNPKETLLSLIAFVVSFVVLTQTGGLTYISCFLSGYCCDSIFSKQEIQTQ
jgi:hypothetical protein